MIRSSDPPVDDRASAVQENEAKDAILRAADPDIALPLRELAGK